MSSNYPAYADNQLRVAALRRVLFAGKRFDFSDV